MGSAERAVELYCNGFVREAESLCAALIAADHQRIRCVALLAEIQLATNRPDEAIATLEVLDRLAPDDAATLRRLGATLLSVGRVNDAVDILRRAVRLEPKNARAHNNLGQALLQSSHVTDALHHFEHAVALDANYAIGLSNLGTAWTRIGQLEKAVSALQQAVEIDASLMTAWLNLGAALARSQRFEDALAAYEEVLKSEPKNVAAWISHGATLVALDRASAALESFDTALRIKPNEATALANKASALQRLNRQKEALLVLQSATALEPRYVDAWCDLSVVHQTLGNDAEAIDCLHRALQIDDSCVRARCGLLSSHIPSIAHSIEEESSARAAFTIELDRFETWVGARELDESAAWTLARQPFFYLSYQEQPNKQLLQRVRTVSAARLARFGPNDFMNATTHAGANANAIGGGRSERRFKLGFASAQMYDHSVFNALSRGLIQGLDHRRFEISIFYLGHKRDSSTELVAAAVDRFDATERSLGDWARSIARHDLDALIFPEIGIDRKTLALAHLRLARRQMASWGHPETSALPTIDEFLSADGLEPSGADEHYSERLIRLPNLGVFYEPVGEAGTDVDLGRLGLSDDAPLFICPGAPFKYRAEDDTVWVEIARRMGDCTLVFFLHERVELSEKLRRRLTNAFLTAGLDANRFLAFLPWMPRPAFLGLMRRADVFLDTLGFSGFNTFMQAVQAHLPGVALDGRFLRGRLGSGTLRHLGLAELVAATPADYVRIAVKLGQDPLYRARMRALLREREMHAYRDQSVIDALTHELLNHEVQGIG